MPDLSVHLINPGNVQIQVSDTFVAWTDEDCECIRHVNVCCLEGYKVLDNRQ